MSEGGTAGSGSFGSEGRSFGGAADHAFKPCTVEP
jgi:hypothetical protein